MSNTSEYSKEIDGINVRLTIEVPRGFEGSVEELVAHTISDDEIRAYIDRYQNSHQGNLESIEIKLDGDEVELGYTMKPESFERIRRITGYLVGDMTKWNNGKCAEEHDRVKHSVVNNTRDEVKFSQAEIHNQLEYSKNMTELKDILAKQDITVLEWRFLESEPGEKDLYSRMLFLVGKIQHCAECPKKIADVMVAISGVDRETHEPPYHLLVELQKKVTEASDKELGIEGYGVEDMKFDDYNLEGIDIKDNINRRMTTNKNGQKITLTEDEAQYLRNKYKNLNSDPVKRNGKCAEVCAGSRPVKKAI